MFEPTQPAQQTQPRTSVARPNKKCWTAHNWAETHHWAQCYSLNNWLSHWCKVSSFHWTTLMQDALDVTGAGYEYDFIWLFTGYSVLNRIVKGYSTGLQQWCDWRGYKGAKIPSNKVNKKLSPYFIYISVCSILFLVFSKLLFYAFYGSFWTVVVFGWLRVLV